MNFIPSSIQFEFDRLVEEINELELCTVSSIDDLKSGFVISQMILCSIRRQDLFTVVQGFTKDKISARWSIILDFMKIHFHLNLDDYLPDEIFNDQGVLFIVCKFITKALKDPKRSSIGRIWASSNTNVQSLYKTFANDEGDSENCPDLEEVKKMIYHWLQDLKIIPPGIYMHEFLYRVRNGLSLFELLRKIDLNFKKNQKFVMKPGSVADCIKNINFILRHLRRNTAVHGRYLYSSAAVYEGNQGVVYGLLADMKDYYVKDNHKIRKIPSPKKNLLTHFSPKAKNSGVKISGPVKNSIIDWISSVGLLNKVIFSEKFYKNSLENGILLCELVQKLFLCEFEFCLKPKTLEDCQNNLKLAFKYLQNKGFQVKSSEVKVSEDLTWSVLFEVMNNYNEKHEANKSINFKDLEARILIWLKSIKFIPQSTKSIFDIVPLMQSGELLQNLINKYCSPTKPIQDSLESLALIKKCLKILKNTQKFPSKYTESYCEIFKGDLIIIIGILEDFYWFLQESKMLDAEKNTVSEFNVYKKTMDLQEWLEKNNIVCGNLAGNVVNEFKTGLKFCEIVEKICGKTVEDTVLEPKTAAQALWNTRKALDVLYSTFAFPQKYKYYDDLLISGDGATIRLFLTDLLTLI